MVKKIVLGILAAIAVAVVVVLGLASTKPDTFRVERAQTVNAPAAKVHAQINDFHNWTAWSPWEDIDPAMKRSYSGPVSGVGATYAWEGNDDVGSGRMEIIDSAPASRVKIRLDFIAPFEAHNTAEFTMVSPVDTATTTNVTWAMYGPNTFMGKVMHVFFDMDAMVGPMFEKGLTKLKGIAESH